jgi:hypothetical protein
MAIIVENKNQVKSKILHKALKILENRIVMPFFIATETNYMEDERIVYRDFVFNGAYSAECFFCCI